MSDIMASDVNEELLTTVLLDIEGGKDEKIKIKNYTIKKASSTGDNYNSRVGRVTVDYCVGDGKLKTQSFVVKVPYKSETFMQLFQILYKKEKYVYLDFLPKVYDLLRIEQYFSPRLLYVNSTYTMVLEDLKACGYVLKDKLSLLDFDHSALCLTTLAKFHAASVILVVKYPDIIDHLVPEYLFSEEKRQINEENLLSISQIFVNMVESWNVFDNFKARTERIWKTNVDDMIRLCKPRENALNVVNHSDTWTNNLLFTYDDSGKPIRVKLIDFQVCRYTTPAMDLQYFLFTSAKEEVMARLSELIEIYLHALNGQLEALGSDRRLERQELDRELRASYPYVFTIVYYVLPFVFTQDDTVIDFSNYGEESFQLSTEDIYRKSYSSKNYKPKAIDRLRFLERKGFF